MVPVIDKPMYIPVESGRSLCLLFGTLITKLQKHVRHDNNLSTHQKCVYIFKKVILRLH